MARQLLAALALVLFVGIVDKRASAQPLDRALGKLTWGMSQAEVEKRLDAKLSTAARDTRLLSTQATDASKERVLTARDPFSRSFYFFRAGKLRKVFTVLEPAVFPEGNFAAFVSALQKHLGPGKQGHGELAPGVTRRWMEWREGRTRLRALDETQHLGCYALVYEAAQ